MSSGPQSCRAAHAGSTILMTAASARASRVSYRRSVASAPLSSTARRAISRVVSRRPVNRSWSASRAGPDKNVSMHPRRPQPPYSLPSERPRSWCRPDRCRFAAAGRHRSRPLHLANAEQPEQRGRGQRRRQRHQHHHREERRGDDPEIQAHVENDQLHQSARIHQNAKTSR